MHILTNVCIFIRPGLVYAGVFPLVSPIYTTRYSFPARGGPPPLARPGNDLRFRQTRVPVQCLAELVWVGFPEPEGWVRLRAKHTIRHTTKRHTEQ